MLEARYRGGFSASLLEGVIFDRGYRHCGMLRRISEHEEGHGGYPVCLSLKIFSLLAFHLFNVDTRRLGTYYKKILHPGNKVDTNRLDNDY